MESIMVFADGFQRGRTSPRRRQISGYIIV